MTHTAILYKGRKVKPSNTLLYFVQFSLIIVEEVHLFGEGYQYNL